MRFFLYELIDPTTQQPFYVGKGCGDRPKQHEREARSGANSRKCRRIRKIWADGGKVGVRIVSRYASEDEAYAAEVERIAEIGLSNLTNVLPGGRGGMAKAVRTAEALPMAVARSIGMVLSLAKRGLRVDWGGFDVTAFAAERLEHLKGALGEKVVGDRLQTAGFPIEVARG